MKNFLYKKLNVLLTGTFMPSKIKQDKKPEYQEEEFKYF